MLRTHLIFDIFEFKFFVKLIPEQIQNYTQNPIFRTIYRFGHSQNTKYTRKHGDITLNRSNNSYA